VVLRATGTPTAGGVHNFALSGTPSCSFSRSTIEGVTGEAGKIWMAYNLGATAPANSSVDIAQYGDLYQWGRGADGHQIKTSGTMDRRSDTDSPGSLFILSPGPLSDWRIPQNISLWQGLAGINNPCPPGFRIPTISEWDLEAAASGIINIETAYTSVLKLTVSGFRVGHSGVVMYEGHSGYYSSSTVNGTQSRGFIFQRNSISSGNIFRGHGLSVRCIKD
jgi:uncharacterized protein (TIGR02145 family)